MVSPGAGWNSGSGTACRRMQFRKLRGQLASHPTQEPERVSAVALAALAAPLQSRAHFGWDNGTLLANLLAVATALGLPAKVVCGFVDATVNGLLDVDSQREVAFSLVAVGHDSGLSDR